MTQKYDVKGVWGAHEFNVLILELGTTAIVASRGADYLAGRTNMDSGFHSASTTCQYRN